MYNMRVTGINYNQYSKSKSNKKKENSTNNLTNNNITIQGNAMLGLENANKAMLSLKNKLSFKGDIKNHVGDNSFLQGFKHKRLKRDNITANSLSILYCDANEIKVKRQVILAHSHAKKITANKVILTEESSADKINAEKVVVKDFCPVEWCPDEFREESSYAKKIEADKVLISNGASADVINAQKVKLKGSNSEATNIKCDEITLINRRLLDEIKRKQKKIEANKVILLNSDIFEDITITEKNTPKLEITGDSIVLGKIIFKNAPGLVTLTPNERGVHPHIDKNNVENGKVVIKGERLNINNSQKEKIDVHEINGTTSIGVEGNIEANLLDAPFVSMRGKSSTDLIKAHTIELYGDEKGKAYAKDIDAKDVSIYGGTATRIKAEDSIELSEGSMVKKNITMTGKENPTIELIGKNISLKGKILFDSKAKDAQVIIHMDENGDYTTIDEDKVQNGVIIYNKDIQGLNINLKGTKKVDNISALNNAELANQVFAKRITAKNSVKLSDSATVEDGITMNGKKNPTVNITGNDVTVNGKVVFPPGAKNAQVVIPPDYPEEKKQELKSNIENGKVVVSK